MVERPCSRSRRVSTGACSQRATARLLYSTHPKDLSFQALRSFQRPRGCPSLSRPFLPQAPSSRTSCTPTVIGIISVPPAWSTSISRGTTLRSSPLSASGPRLRPGTTAETP
ncbi:unnamed protein product, partial [Ectocarpus sp. 12 AP-2014]